MASTRRLQVAPVASHSAVAGRPDSAPGAAAAVTPKRGSAKRFIALSFIVCGTVSWLLAVATGLAAPLLPRFISDPPALAKAQSGLPVLSIYLAIGGAVWLGLLAALRGGRREWERVFELVLAQRRHFGGMLAGSFVVVLAEMSLPAGLGWIIGTVVNQRRDPQLLNYAMLGLALVLLARGIAGYFRQFNAQALAYEISASLRTRLFAKLQRMNFGFFDRARQGELMSTVTNDVEKLQFFLLNSSEDFFVAPLKVYIAVGCVFFGNWEMALIILCTLVPMGMGMQYTSRRLRRVNEHAQERIAELTAELAEGINTIRLAQSFGLEARELDSFRAANDGALRKLLSHARMTGVLLPLIDVLGFVGPLLIIATLCYRAVASQADFAPSELITLAGYGAMVANPLGKLSRIMATLGQGEAASQRINRILDARAEIADKPGAVTLGSVDGLIEFESVSLRYGEGEPQVLRDFSLTVAPGEVVAFVGESGSGKSSIVNLVPRFYDASSGRVLLDGHDVRDLTLASLRGQIGMVSQDTILVHGTVRENIAYGTPQADEKDILDAAMSANAHNFIMEFPQGYDTPVGERGVTLSGGQRQRIAIARALLRDPRILLLDEATSALDSVSEAMVQDALNKLMYGRTTLLVAHRLSTVRHANRIVVLAQGRVAETGTHDALLAIGGEYARLWRMQSAG
jgi:subfamily B ATP-binding cassette protein MsbA